MIHILSSFAISKHRCFCFVNLNKHRRPQPCKHQTHRLGRKCLCGFPEPEKQLLSPLLCLQAHSLSHVQLFGHCNPIDHSLPGSFAHGIFAGKNTGVGCYFLLQGIFPTQGWNPVSPALAGEFFTNEPPGKPSP